MTLEGFGNPFLTFDGKEVFLVLKPSSLNTNQWFRRGFCLLKNMITKIIQIWLCMQSDKVFMQSLIYSLQSFQSTSGRLQFTQSSRNESYYLQFVAVHLKLPTCSKDLEALKYRTFFRLCAELIHGMKAHVVENYFP